MKSSSTIFKSIRLNEILSGLCIAGYILALGYALSAIPFLAFSGMGLGLLGAAFADSPSANPYAGFQLVGILGLFLLLFMAWLILLLVNTIILHRRKIFSVIRWDCWFMLVPIILASLSILAKILLGDNAQYLGNVIPQIYPIYLTCLVASLIITTFYSVELMIQTRPHRTSPSQKPEIPQQVSVSQKALGISSLLDAVVSNNIDDVRLILTEYPEQLNIVYAQNGNTPLHVASWNGYTEIVRILLEQPGIDKIRKNNDGKTARDMALEKNFSEIAELLK